MRVNRRERNTPRPATPHRGAMTPTHAGLLGLVTAGTTGTVLLVRLFVRALEEIDVEISLDPQAGAKRRTNR